MSEPRSDSRYMELKIGEQLYAVPLLSVREVIQKPDVTVVPNAPEDFEGMMNLRGQILGVFNVKKRLGGRGKPVSSEILPVVVVIEDSGVRVGVIVDEVTRVLNPDPKTVKPAPLKEDDPGKKYIESVMQTGSELVLILDLEQLLELQKYKSFLKAA
jgi:purine-binding chemotaxis protein CheW